MANLSDITIDPASEAVYGDASGTIRILLAAVQRLSEENVRLIGQNVAMKRALGRLSSARLEMIDPDGRVTSIGFGLEEAAEEDDGITAASPVPLPVEELELPDDWTDLGVAVGGFEPFDAAADFRPVADPE